MKAWLLDKLDGIQSLRLSDAPDPIPGPGEAVVCVQLAGLNPADYYLAQGEYPAKPVLPHILGRDGLGVIESAGTDCASFKPGDRVILLRSEVGVNRPGTFAEKVVVPVESLATIPDGWTDPQAAGAALVYLTAYQALSQWSSNRLSVDKSAVVLVTGASGGVGVATVQLAAAAGHTVIAMSRDKTKRDTLLTLGAKYCFDPMQSDWPDQIKKTLGKLRVDLAVDSVGGTGFSQLLGLMNHEGKISVVGRLAGPVPEFNTASLFFKRLKIGGVSVGDYSAPEAQAAWSQIVQTLNRAAVKPVVDSVFEFENLKGGFAKLQQGPMGKVLLRVRV